MKAYGHSRRDKLECKYGCCTGKSGAKKNCRKEVDRTKRKTAPSAKLHVAKTVRSLWMKDRNNSISVF